MLEINTSAILSDSELQLRLGALATLNHIGVELSTEKNRTLLLEKILREATRLTNADGGTLYTRTEDNHLKFEILFTHSKGIHLGGTSGNAIHFPPLALYQDTEQKIPNSHLVSICAAISGNTINISDAYSNTEFEFSGTRKFDEKNNYYSKSFLTVPMKGSEGEIIGVLQLINAIDPYSGEIGAFDQFKQELVESLASQAAVAMVNQRLLAEQRELFDAFIRLIATAIDQKSPYTGEHCLRVPKLTMMLAEATASVKHGVFRDFTMNDDDRYELTVAGWLHDCGKITTPEYIIDKATKLETIFDRIHLIDTRIEVLKRDAEIALLRQQLAAAQRGEPIENVCIDPELNAQIENLNAMREFIRKHNTGTEWMSDEDVAKMRQFAAQYRWVNADGVTVDFLSENELANLTVRKGTLLPEERNIINQHIHTTIKMLESLPYPKYLQHVVEYAGGHHERMDGKGYPKGLTREQMSVQARIMGIADIFEALTARDRPYKKPMPLSQALDILGKMKLDNHIDPDLFDVFIHEKVYLEFAEKFLPKDQNDADNIDVSKITGFNAEYGMMKDIK